MVLNIKILTDDEIIYSSKLSEKISNF